MCVPDGRETSQALKICDAYPSEPFQQQQALPSGSDVSAAVAMIGTHDFFGGCIKQENNSAISDRILCYLMLRPVLRLLPVTATSEYNISMHEAFAIFYKQPNDDGTFKECQVWNLEEQEAREEAADLIKEGYLDVEVKAYDPGM